MAIDAASNAATTVRAAADVMCRWCWRGRRHGWRRGRGDGPGATTSPVAGGRGRGAEQWLQLVGRPAQGQGAAGHVQGCDELAYLWVDRSRRLPAEQPVERAIEHEQLFVLGAAQAIDEHPCPAGSRGSLGQQTGQQQLGERSAGIHSTVSMPGSPWMPRPMAIVPDPPGTGAPSGPGRCSLRMRPRTSGFDCWPAARCVPPSRGRHRCAPPRTPPGTRRTCPRYPAGRRCARQGHSPRHRSRARCGYRCLPRGPAPRPSRSASRRRCSCRR